jgi:hypothetical protein
VAQHEEGSVRCAEWQACGRCQEPREGLVAEKAVLCVCLSSDSSEMVNVETLGAVLTCHQPAKSRVPHLLLSIHEKSRAVERRDVNPGDARPQPLGVSVAHA